MIPKITEIIPEEKYIETSLHGLVKRLSQPDHEPTEQEVANLVIKYFWSYCDPSQRPASLSEITSLMHIYEYYFAHLRFMVMGAKFDFSNIPPLLASVFRFADKHGYPVSMLGDVSSTTTLVRSIVMQNINATGDFHGLDIGSGTWILALAQYILAKRKWAKNIRIDWLEQDRDAARHSEQVLRKLIPGQFFHMHRADATRVNGYKKISGKPDFISIEMLPQPGTDLIFEIPRGMPWIIANRDPLIPSIRALVQKYSWLAQVHTFPSSLNLHVSLWLDNLSWFKVLPMTGPESIFEFCSFDVEKVKKWFNRMSVYWAQLDSQWEIIPLEKVWAHLHKTPDNPDGWIKFSPLWMHRWKKMVSHNPWYEHLLRMYGNMIPLDWMGTTVMPMLKWHDVVTP